MFWEEFDLEERLGQDTGKDADSDPMVVNHSFVSRELAWLKQASQQRLTNLTETMPAILDLAQRIAAQYNTRLEIAQDDTLPCLTVHPVACRQILLNLLSVVMPWAASGCVRISTRTRGWEVEIRVQCTEYPSGPKPALEHEIASLNMAHELTGSAEQSWRSLSTPRPSTPPWPFLPSSDYRFW